MASSAKITKSTTSTNMPSDWNFASRSKDPSPIGSALFIILRALDVYLQYSILHHFSTTAASPSLTPYYTLIVALSLGSALKQIVWQAFISEQTMPPIFALVIASYNTLLNTLNTLLSLWSRTSGGAPRGSSNTSDPTATAGFAWYIYLGLAMYIVGIVLELGSEVQRKSFKADPRNKGKPCGVGLWALATNVNYGGYALWRSGYACVAGRTGWAALVLGGVSYDFVTRAIPSMETYLEGKYGKEYTRIKARVPYRFIPYVY